MRTEKEARETLDRALAEVDKAKQIVHLYDRLEEAGRRIQDYEQHIRKMSEELSRYRKIDEAISHDMAEIKGMLRKALEPKKIPIIRNIINRDELERMAILRDLAEEDSEVGDES